MSHSTSSRASSSARERPASPTGRSAASAGTTEAAPTALQEATRYVATSARLDVADAARAIARIGISAADAEHAAREILDVLECVAPGSITLIAIRDEEEPGLRVLATHADLPSRGARIHCTAEDEADDTRPCSAMPTTLAPSGVLPLRAGGRLVGALGLSQTAEADGEPLPAVVELVPVIALVLETLRLREDAIRRHVRQRTLAMALETLEQPVFICSSRALILYANSAAVREFGFSREAFAGMSARQLCVQLENQPHTSPLDTAVREQGAWAGELVQRRNDGSEFPAWIAVRAIRDDAGADVGVVVSVQNLTEQRRVAEQLRQSERLMALGELVAGVVHEVNNPLTGISAFAQLLLEAELPPEQLEAAQIIKREADRAASVVRDLLTFARKTGPRSISVDLNTLVEQSLRLRQYALQAASIAVERRLDPELPPVWGDDRQLQQVLMNLIVNAEHAMASQPRRELTIRTCRQNDRVVVEIGDTGTGMTPDVQQRVFEPFFTTKGDGKGTGLGLSVSYGIVQAHGGTIAVQSAPGAGATFRVALPIDRRGKSESR